MADFSDDERFEVDSILQQRKRKGVLEYLIRWKNADASETWEPAKNVKADCAVAIEAFEKTVKARKRSSSRSRSSKSRSRSRSRSSTRIANRKKTTKSKSAEKGSDSPEKKKAAGSEGDSVDKAGPSTSSAVTAVTTTETKQKDTVTEKKAEVPVASSASGRVLRSSTIMATQQSRSELEVQRVHNEQRPVREDDKTPRSAIWKVADYAVIVLFVISAFAALFLFIQKFTDLEDFKKQAFPSLTVLQGRLGHVRDRLLELGNEGAEKLSEIWLLLVEQIKGAPAKENAAPKQ